MLKHRNAYLYNKSKRVYDIWYRLLLKLGEAIKLFLLDNFSGDKSVYLHCATIMTSFPGSHTKT